MANKPSQSGGFYAPGRGTRAAYPELWDGCVGAWAPLLGNTGTSTLPDLSGCCNHGAMTSVVTSDWGSHRQCYALDFPTAGTRSIDFGSSESLRVDTQFTITMWANRPTSHRIGLSRWMSAPDLGYAFQMHTLDRLYISMSGTGSDNNNIYCNLPTGERERLLHVAAVFDAGSAALFVDGVEQAVAGSTGSVPSSIYNTSLALKASVGAAASVGQYAEMRLYNRALAPAAIRQLALRPGIAYEQKRWLPIHIADAGGGGSSGFHKVAGRRLKTKLRGLVR